MLGLGVALHLASRYLVGALRARERPWAQRLAARLGGGEEEGSLRELSWLHWAFTLTLWPAVGLGIAMLYGHGDMALVLMQRLVDAGFSAAGIRIVPARILLGIVVAAILVTLVRWLRGRAEQRWLSRSAMDAPTRESLATIAGYAGFLLAVLIGISVAGVNLTNLAIIAGALSVGIGFGLQNIVNNFVSGLILLFERPLRRGDYVRIGDVEGVVRKVHIRATEIESLDRISVVVPNSELISQPLHNWKLRDAYLRVTVRIGVAYGSDVEQVASLIRKVGVDHPATLPDGTPGVPDAHVLFVDFADSALLFDLRVFIRDADRRAQVASDLRFAINKALQEAGITIPFPQRDLWVRQLPDAAPGG